MAIDMYRFLKGIILQEVSDKTKTITIQPGSGSTTGTNTTVTAAQTANRTITLPDATTTVVGTDAVQAITNKTSIGVGNLLLSGNTVASSNTNGNIILDPNGSGSVVVDNLSLNGNTITATNSNGSIIFSPNGSGSVTSDSAGGVDLGATATPFATVYSVNFQASTAAGTPRVILTASTTTPSGATAPGLQNNNTSTVTSLVLMTSNNATANSTATGSLLIETGNKTAGTGNSGNISLRLGTSSGGTRGKIRFIDGSEGTPGFVWTQTASDGSGGWASATSGLSTFADNTFRIFDNGDGTKQLAFEVSAIATGTTKTITIPNSNLNLSVDTSGTFANNLLSNLATTAVNVTIKPASDFAIDLGSASLRWDNVYAQNLSSAADNLIIQTGIATNSGNLTIKTGTASGTRGKILLVDGSEGVAGKIWTSTDTGGQGRWAFSTVASKTTTYTALATDNLILVDTSGGSFTLNLPAAAGVSGKQYSIKKTTTDFNTLTIDPNSSETIDGQATTTINTKNECLIIISDGSNWQILERRIPLEWETFTPTGQLTTNTTYTGKRRREGDSWRLRMRMTFSGANTQGDIRFNIPDSQTLDTSKALGGNNMLYGSAIFSDSSVGPEVLLGFAFPISDAIDIRFMDESPASSHYTNLADSNANFPVAIASGDFVEIDVLIPITGWKG